MRGIGRHIRWLGLEHLEDWNTETDIFFLIKYIRAGQREKNLGCLPHGGVRRLHALTMHETAAFSFFTPGLL